MTDTDPIAALEERKAQLTEELKSLMVEKASRIAECDLMLNLLRTPTRQKPGPKPGSSRRKPEPQERSSDEVIADLSAKLAPDNATEAA